MKLKDTWALDFCTPSNWTTDFTKPGGEWDTEVKPTPLEEFVSGGYHNHFIYFAQQVGKSFTAAAKVLTENMNHIHISMQPVCEMMEELTETELNKRGTYTVKSQKAGVKLPKRKVNCGPPAKRFDRRMK